MNKILRILLCAGIPLVFAAGAAQASDIKKQCGHRYEAGENDVGYCDAVRIGNTLYISGHVGQGEMGPAIRMAYDDLRKTLADHGLDFHNVVKENVYATDLDAFIKNKELRKPYYAGDYPAATWVQVQRLYSPRYAVEIELVAVFPE